MIAKKIPLSFSDTSQYGLISIKSISRINETAIKMISESLIRFRLNVISEKYNKTKL